MTAGQSEELKNLLSGILQYYFPGLSSLSLSLSSNPSQTRICCHSQGGMQFPGLRRIHPSLDGAHMACKAVDSVGIELHRKPHRSYVVDLSHLLFHMRFEQKKSCKFSRH